MLEQCLDLINQEQYEAAIECLQPYLEGERAAEAACMTGFCYGHFGQLDTAIYWFNKAIAASEDENYANASYNKGCCFDEQGKWLEAIAAYKEAIAASVDGKFPDASYKKGGCFYKLGQWPEAITAYDEAIAASVDGKYPPVSFAKGLCFEDWGKLWEAVAAYNEAILASADGTPPSVFYNKGLCFYKLRQWQEAITAYDEAIVASVDGKFPDASYNKGLCFYKLGQWPEAITAYNEAIVTSEYGKFPRASYKKGGCFYELGQLPEAITAYDEAVAASEHVRYPASSFNKGHCFHDLGKWPEAIAAYSEAIATSVDEKFPDASVNKGYCFLRLRKYPQVIESCDKAIADSPNGYHPGAWFNKAFAQRELSEQKEARISAFTAILQDSELKEVSQFISDYYTIYPAYANRVKLFDIVFMRQLQNINATTSKSLPQALRNFVDETPTGLYTSLLLHPADLLGTGLGHTARLRQAYLMAAANKEPAWVFYIINYLLYAKDGYALDALDYYFYLTSAQQVAAPLKELERIADEAGYTGLSFEAVDEYLHQLATPLPTDGLEACPQNDTEKLLYHEHWLAQQPYTVTTSRTELELRYLALALGSIPTSDYQSTNIHFMNLRDNLQKIGVSVEQVGSSLKALLDTATQEEMLQSMQMITEAEVAGILSAKDANLLKAFALFKFEKVRQHTIKEAQKGGVDLLTASLGSAAAGHVVGLFVPGYFLYSFAIGLVGTVVTNLLRQPSIDAIAFEWQDFVKLLEEGKDLREEVGVGDV